MTHWKEIQTRRFDRSGSNSIPAPKSLKGPWRSVWSIAIVASAKELSENKMFEERGFFVEINHKKARQTSNSPARPVNSRLLPPEAPHAAPLLWRRT